MELLLIRHGLPVRIENTDGTPADPPLSPAGLDQSRRLAQWLEFESIDALYASPMKRAYETAVPFSERSGMDICIEPGVAEFDRESEIYIPIEEIKEQDPERWRALAREGIASVEEFEVFSKGVVETVERIIRSHPGERVAVMCHGGVINSFASRVLGIGAPFFFNPTYTSINRFLAASSGERSLVSLNESAHLITAR
jgi:probable phosphoglycerate mutase